MKTSTTTSRSSLVIAAAFFAGCAGSPETIYKYGAVEEYRVQGNLYEVALCVADQMQLKWAAVDWKHLLTTDQIVGLFDIGVIAIIDFAQDGQNVSMTTTTTAMSPSRIHKMVRESADVCGQ